MKCENGLLVITNMNGVREDAGGSGDEMRK